ncbi:hypothetical protein Tco_0692654 [Tanacetum coccineum]
MHTIKDDSVLGRLKFVAKNEDCQVYGKTIPNNMVSKEIKKTTAYKTYFAFSTGKVVHKKATASDDSDPEPAKKPTRKRKPIGVVIKDTPAVSKKKTPIQTQKHKGMEMLLGSALLKEAQTSKALKIIRRETSFRHQTCGLSEGAGSKLEVLDEPKGKSVDISERVGLKPEVPDVSEVMSSDQESENESWGDSEDDDDDHQKTQEDEFVHTPDNYVPTDDETQDVDDEEYVSINEELYGDVNVEMKDVEPTDEGKGDEEITDVRVSDLEKEVKESRNVDHSTTLLATIKSEVPTGVKEYLGTNLGDTLHKVLQRHTAELIQEHSVPADVVEYTMKSSDKAALQEFDQKQAMFETMTESKSFNKHSKHMTLKHADGDRDEDPPAGSNQWLKKRKTSKDTEPPKRPKLTSSSKDTTRSQPKSTSKSIKKPVRPPTPDPEWNKGKSVDNEPTQTWLNDLSNISELTKADLVGPIYNLLKGTCKSCVELEYNMEECYHALSDQLDWNNPKGNRCPYDLSKPLPLHESRGRLIVPANFFFNNDIEYLRGGSTDRKYTASTTKTKAAKVSRHDVYSTMRILSVTSVTVDEWYGYNHLKEIVMRRAYQKLYKFMEGDFPRLHMNDINDMLLLVTQNKLNNLDDNVIVHLAVGLHINVDVSRRAPYTTLSEPQGVTYEDMLKRKRLMRTKELYKFSDGILTLVCNTLDQMLKNLKLGYNKDMKRRK